MMPGVLFRPVRIAKWEARECEAVETQTRRLLMTTPEQRRQKEPPAGKVKKPLKHRCTFVWDLWGGSLRRHLVKRSRPFVLQNICLHAFPLCLSSSVLRSLADKNLGSIFPWKANEKTRELSFAAKTKRERWLIHAESCRRCFIAKLLKVSWIWTAGIFWKQEAAEMHKKCWLEQRQTENPKLAKKETEISRKELKVTKK